MDPFEGDKTWAEVVFAALDHGTGSVESAEAGPLIPFAMTRDTSGPRLTRFVGNDYAEDAKKALAFARAGAFTYWAVAWDGFITLANVRTDAVFVHAGRASGPGEVLFAWRYDRGPEGVLRRIGNPAFLGPPD